MRISVKNLAHIKNAEDIELKNFNIFIGKNGTGKTYFAKLVYFITSIKYKIQMFNKLFSKKTRYHFDNKSDIQFTSEEQSEFIKEFKNHIKSSFPDFINSKKELFKTFDFLFDLGINIIDIQYKNEFDTFEEYSSFVTVNFIEKLFSTIESHYLPAARANYMITYKYLFDSQFNNFRDVLLNKSSTKKISILPEVENNFLKDIYRVNTKIRGELYSLGAKIEKNIFRNGKLSIKNPQSQELPTYEYRLNDLKQNIDLVTASSSVTELSPLIMYFRYKIINVKNEMLIIDEPELSLHPDAQAQLVSVLVEAVNKGLKIILVTHSPYIIEVLNNHLQRHKIENYSLDTKLKNFEPINPNQVGGYLFEDNTIKNILDEETNLIDDKLLNSFNTINDIYDDMRDVEWENTHA